MPALAQQANGKWEGEGGRYFSSEEMYRCLQIFHSTEAASKLRLILQTSNSKILPAVL